MNLNPELSFWYAHVASSRFVLSQSSNPTSDTPATPSSATPTSGMHDAGIVGNISVRVVRITSNEFGQARGQFHLFAIVFPRIFNMILIFKFGKV
jgi:hypothetical protein